MLGSSIAEYVGGIWANAVNMAATKVNDRYGASISYQLRDHQQHTSVMHFGQIMMEK